MLPYKGVNLIYKLTKEIWTRVCIDKTSTHTQTHIYIMYVCIII